jgi:arginine decarboxylase
MSRTHHPADSARMPLVEALLQYERRKPASFHVPGHKRGAAYRNDPQVASWLGAVGLYDATELPGLDDLHDPQGAIAEAERLAADAFGSKRTFFLVGGSTVGNLAMIGAVCRSGDYVLMQRNAHKSAIHALMLSQAGAVFLPPEQDRESGLYTSPSPELIDVQLSKFPGTKAVFITNPNYFGMSADLRKIAEVVHKHGKPLLVDEAHGAHFGLDPLLPESALQCGADAVVQSTHKMLPAMTMGAMLHVGSDRVDERILKRLLGMLQSSSPSYPIMASLDYARAAAAQNRGNEQGAGPFREGLDAAHYFRERLRCRAGRFRILERAPDAGYTSLDPLKIAVYDAEARLTGYQLLTMLHEQGCDAEMADERHALLIFGMNSTRSDAEHLLDALQRIGSMNLSEKQEIRLKMTNILPLWSAASTQPVFFDADGVRKPAHLEGDPVAVEIERAVGLLSAEMVVPYPPGIPLLFPGERISSETASALARYRSDGAAVQGISDKSLRSILVWAGNDI